MWKIKVTYETVCEIQGAATMNATRGIDIEIREENAPPSGRSGTLQWLLELPVSELRAMYAHAKTPRLEDVDGDLRGRMLAWPMLDGHPIAQGALRAFAGSSPFPWRGKSFHGDPKRGDGIKRVFSDRFRLFSIEKLIAKSRAGDFDALQLDYDRPGNPPVIRSIKDEIREIEPGVWLGQAYLQAGGRDRLWLYFALAKP
jgi:hypothetical protein